MEAERESEQIRVGVVASPHEKPEEVNKMYNIYITKVIDKKSEQVDKYIRDSLERIFDEVDVHVFTIRKTAMAWGSGYREWHEAIEIEYGTEEPDLMNLGVVVYNINKAFSGAKAVYSVTQCNRTKPFFIGSHGIMEEQKDDPDSEPTKFKTAYEVMGNKPVNTP